MQTDNHVKPDAEPASVAPVRVQRSVGLPSMTPLVTNGRCYHEWIKQPDGSYTCWKCGEEKPAGSVEDRQPNALRELPLPSSSASTTDAIGG